MIWLKRRQLLNTEAGLNQTLRQQRPLYYSEEPRRLTFWSRLGRKAWATEQRKSWQEKTALHSSAAKRRLLLGVPQLCFPQPKTGDQFLSARQIAALSGGEGSTSAWGLTAEPAPSVRQQPPSLRNRRQKSTQINDTHKTPSTLPAWILLSESISHR